jgi:hypothetical protein
MRLVNAWGEPSWEQDQFSPVEEPGTRWRLGTGSPVEGMEIIEIAIPQEVLDAVYGEDAAERIQSVEAELELITFNPPLLIDNEVYFGAGLKPANGISPAVSAQIEVPQAGVFNIAQRVGATVTVAMQRSVSPQVARIRLERDMANNVLAVFVNGDRIGTSISFPGTDNPVLPVIYVRAGGVIVHVNRWQIILR